MNKIDDGVGCFAIIAVALVLVAIGAGGAFAIAQNLGAPHGDAGLYYSDRAAWEAKRAEQDRRRQERDESKTGASPYQPYGAGAPDGWYERHGYLQTPYGWVKPSGKADDAK
jgi:hypothetical protein